jgi:hypothetical protein
MGEDKRKDKRSDRKLCDGKRMRREREGMIDGVGGGSGIRKS